MSRKVCVKIVNLLEVQTLEAVGRSASGQRPGSCQTHYVVTAVGQKYRGGHPCETCTSLGVGALAGDAVAAPPTKSYPTMIACQSSGFA